MVVVQYALACFLWSQSHVRFSQKLRLSLDMEFGAVLWSMVAIFGQSDALPPISIAPLTTKMAIMYLHNHQNRPNECKHGFQVKSLDLTNGDLSPIG